LLICFGSDAFQSGEEHVFGQNENQSHLILFPLLKADMICTMKEEITELQIKAAYLEDEMNALNDIVTSQGSLIASLEKKLLALEKRLENVEEEDRPDRRPPHY
jgi:uncharacterized coiled-coil protein SlyX